MSETKLLKTDAPTANGEPVTAKSNRAFNWISRHRWYLIGSLFVLLIARSEAKRAETATMQANRQAVESMSRVERNRLRHNQEQFQKLASSDIARIRAVHNAVQKDDRLDEAVSQFHSWLATLPLPQREKLLATSDTYDRLQMMRQIISASESTRSGNENTFPTEPVGRMPISNMRVPPADYERMMIAAARWGELPDSPESDSSIGRLEFHTSVMAGVMDRIAPAWRVPFSRPGNRVRPVFPDGLRSALLDELNNPAMKRMIESRPSTQQNMMAVTILARGLFDESRRTVQALKPSKAELDRLYQSLPEVRRNSLDSMPDEFSNRHLQQLWLSRRLSPEAGENLSRLWSLFDKLFNRQPNGQRGSQGTKRADRYGTDNRSSGDKNRKDR